MGRETVTVCHWKDGSAPTRLLLEAEELILRGGLKARLPRSEISSVEVTAEGLVVTTLAGILVAELDPKEAKRWAEALKTPPPTLAAKLGLTADKTAYVNGEVTDAVLAEALTARTAPITEADLIVAVVLSPADLGHAVRLAQNHPALPLWCVYRKGPTAAPGDAAIRDAMRGSGCIDTKACSVSPQLTATRYNYRG